MRVFTKLAPEIWLSNRFNALGAEAKLLLLYLLTNTHQNSSGCYRLPAGYACDDLGGWSIENYRKALDELRANTFILTDEQTTEVFIDKWFQHNPPMNPKHLLGTKRIVSKIQSEVLRMEVSRALQEEWEKRKYPMPSDMQDNDPASARARHLLNTPHMRRGSSN